MLRSISFDKFIKSAKELFSQKKSVLIIKSATYTNTVMGKTSVFFVETLPTFSVNIWVNRSDCGKIIWISGRKYNLLKK